ncbi:hypothetical protein Slin15195_G105160 [Septoria linicola]|uniref:Uncharacterized protein n=1 Tax=Septoria linicola TaxID=215465 RepID=A0A9Q9EP15_9PEZI|nr:hypothetical protein Slin15195_G105160 [Septoria linicola]
MEDFLVKKVRGASNSYQRYKTTISRLGSRKARPGSAPISTVSEKNKEKTLTFFSLPPEIRNRIYDETLVLEEGDAVVLARAPYKEPALLRADSRIHDEAFKMYYTMTDFEVEDVDHALRFLQSLCTCVIPMLRSVRVPIVRCFGAYHASYLR